jgi:hypothetical protein
MDKNERLCQLAEDLMQEARGMINMANRFEKGAAMLYAMIPPVQNPVPPGPMVPPPPSRWRKEKMTVKNAYDLVAGSLDIKSRFKVYETGWNDAQAALASQGKECPDCGRVRYLGPCPGCGHREAPGVAESKPCEHGSKNVKYYYRCDYCGEMVPSNNDREAPGDK